MNPLLRLAGCASLLGLFFLGAFAFLPVFEDEAGFNPGEWLRYRQIFESETERGEELEQQNGRAIERHHAKNAIARELIAGRLSLAEAVRRFDDLPFPPANMRDLLRRCYGGASDAESMTRHVIEWTCQLLDREPDREAALRARLEAELRSAVRDAQDPS
jgi:hypothetical protein